MAERRPRFSRRMNALLWCFAVAIIIGILIYLEQIAMLYVIATLGLVALLLIVGFSDLKNVDRGSIEGFAANDE